MTQETLRIGDLLQERGYIQLKHLDFALQAQKVTKEKLGQVLTRIGIVSEYDLISTLSKQLNLKHVDLDKLVPEQDALQRFNRNVCLKLKILPLALKNGQLLVATSELPNQQMSQACLRYSGAKPQFVLAEDSKIVSSVYNYFYFLEHPVEEGLEKETRILAADSTMTTSPDNFIHFLLLLAVKKRATDIHIRPMEHGISIALRIDGVLHSQYDRPPQLKRIITSLKLAADMDISEQRLPQDGRWTTEVLQKRYDIRVSTIVTPFGENMVMRLLSQGKGVFSLESLGFFPDDLKKLQTIFEEPYGIVLLTGPTGSGKSTTLVAGLTSIDLLEKNALTIENPIEYFVPLARQTQTNPAAGYDFADAMRYFLRHDPDIILIGEMRDETTARTALTASTTGHLVLSTLHSNTALGAIPRLKGLGMDNLTMAETLIAVISQRLVRTICPQCRESYTPSESECSYLGIKQEISLQRGRGCSACSNTGYLGRTLIYEILAMDTDIRNLLEKDGQIYELEEMVAGKGFKTMFDNGRRKVLDGTTTVEELRRTLGTRKY
jgi:general secretion pathway protein E/type IV pilus assembly protein PilB